MSNDQKTTDELGSASATTTLSGKQLPPPDPTFGGVIEQKASESKAWWPPRVVPPKGAPNVLLIMTDDVGVGAPGTFGGSFRHQHWIVSRRMGCAACGTVCRATGVSLTSVVSIAQT